MGGSNRIGFFAQPERDDHARLFSVSVLDQPGGFTDDAFAARREFENRVGEEDRAIQRAFDVLAVPIALDEECHVRADRASVAFRRILGRMARNAEQGEGSSADRPAQSSFTRPDALVPAGAAR
jgi:hypothetical protein